MTRPAHSVETKALILRSQTTPRTTFPGELSDRPR
jgi:hypothetical protein